MPKPPKRTDSTQASRTSVDLIPNRCAIPPATPASTRSVSDRVSWPLIHVSVLRAQAPPGARAGDCEAPPPSRPTPDLLGELAWLEHRRRDAHATCG